MTRDVAHARANLDAEQATIDFDATRTATEAIWETMLARVELPNPDGAWRPGLFVTGDLVVEESELPVTVDVDALQSYRDWTVVFVQVGDVFEVRPVETGRRDEESVEIVSGLTAGERYAATNSFVLKAELGKSAASHDH